MNPLFNKLLGNKEVQVVEPQPSQPIQTNKPIPLTIDSAEVHQRASLVGWVANKLAQLLGIDTSLKGVYLNSSLTKNSNDLDTDKQEDYILYLADTLVSWVEHGEDVYFNIRHMDLKMDCHKNLLLVYELIKENKSLYFNRKPPDEKEVTEIDRVWEVYRDVLHAASQTKFLLIKEDDLPKYKEGRILCNEYVVEKLDIPRVRNIAKEALELEGFPRTSVSSYVLLISEAITNIIKHAKDGRLLIVRNDSSLNIIIEDTGSGFPLKTLPYTVMMAGYSTKKSLGQGFTLMMKLASQVLLKTSIEGATIILLFNGEEGGDN
jgi:anti-sigma regulatory factor (Ser/Thr protein kinase)